MRAGAAYAYVERYKIFMKMRGYFAHMVFVCARARARRAAMRDSEVRRSLECRKTKSDFCFVENPSALLHPDDRHTQN